MKVKILFPYKRDGGGYIDRTNLDDQWVGTIALSKPRFFRQGEYATPVKTVQQAKTKLDHLLRYDGHYLL